MSEMNLYKKISLVMQDIQYLQKDDKVSTGASGSYKALSEEKVTETVRQSLIKHGLVIMPIEQQHRREELRDKEGILKNYLSIVDTKYKIVDIDTGQFEILASGGTGADSQDKGIGKSMTYSYKYLLLRTFAIPSGEDSDKVSSATLDEQHEAEKTPSPKPSLSTLKAKYQIGKGSIDGFEQWVEDQRSKGRSEQDMNAILTKALEDKKSDQEALAEASRANMAATSKISDKQYGLFKNKAKAAGYQESDYNMISQGFEAATPRDIDKSKFNDVLHWMEKNPKGKGDPFDGEGVSIPLDDDLPF